MIENKHRQCLAFMENDTTLTKKGLLEPVTPGSVTFESSILAPLQSNYLYEESKEYFTYHSAHLIVNRALCSRYSDFCAEKRANGYSKEQLEESFGFLLCDDESRVIRLAETGLVVGQSTCTTLGDCSKGVYISKYSDCLDLKRWYDGKKGFIVLFKLTKGRIKEVTENYTQNFTPPSAGFDCHVSEQIRAVCATTSSFLAFERTQYYMYELLDGGSKVEPCPRHVCPFATVTFSYGKPTISLKEKRQEKASFQYQPWRGQLQIGSISYNISMQSSNGAMFPANLPKTIEISRAVKVSELKKTLPQTIFETSLLGEVPLDGRWFSLYDVMSLETKPDLSLLTQELKSKDMALLVCLKDSGILVFLHSSNFLSYEGVGAEKAFSLQGMFIFPDTRSVPRETKICCKKKTASAEVLQVLPALNYAESEMEKCPLKQQEEPLGLLERHLQNFAALILPGLPSSPGREASMFPDQYDVPNGFPLIAPKWTADAGARLKSYLEKPRSFEISLSRVLALLASGKQQRTDDHDDDVYYYISSPEAPQTPAYVVLEREPANESEQVHVKKSDSGEVRNSGAAELSVSALPEKIKVPDTTPSPRIGDLPTKHYSNEMTDSKKASDSDPGECRNKEMEVSLQTEADADGDLCKKVPHSTPVDEAQISKEAQLETMSSMTPTEPSSTGSVESQSDSKTVLRRPGRRRKRKALKRILKPVNPIPSPFPNTTLLDGLSVDSTSEGSNKMALMQTPPIAPKKDWRSLPRRKKHWKADSNIRRSLRSDVRATVEETAANLGENVLSNRFWEHTPKRKMEGVNMRERYGLKTIITDCGRVFVPHGSDVATDGNKSGEHANTQETPLVTESSPATESLLEKENNDHHVPLTHIENIPVSPFAKTGSDVRSHDSPETLESNLKPTSPGKTKSNTKEHVYKAISISKLKTVLKRARVKPPGTKDSGKSDDPDLKKNKADVDVNLNLGEKIQQSYKSLKTSAQEMLLSKLAKENGASIFDNSSPFDIVKQADQQLISAIIGDRVGGKLISPDGKGSKEGLAIGLAVPSDALNLLADLALSVNTDKTVPNAAAKPRQEVHAGAKTCDSPKSVLHNLLRGSARLKLPTKSPFPEGLVVTGDLILEISKEHSYSQPSLTSFPVSPSKAHFILHSRVPSDLPDETGSSVRQPDKAENGLGSPVHLEPPTLDTRTKLQKFVFLRQRRVVEKEGSIKVTRFWKEDYDFRFDSKFTNEKLDKCVTRALHGKWDFHVEDTFEQVHLIFHMWIGLFYSKPTSRFFNFDHNYPILERKDPTQVLLNNVPPTAPALGADLEDKHKSPHPISDALDLSVKVVGDEENHADEQTSDAENATLSSCIRSEMETMRENKEADCSASGQPQIVFMAYRSNVLNENSASADNYPSDLEEDITDVTNDSYTELLDNNSAYTHLCDETSEITIDEQKSVGKKAFNSKGLTKTLRIKSDGKLASGSAVSVFHQVVSTVRPTVLFKTNEPAGKNKILIKALSFKYKTRNEGAALASKLKELEEAALSEDTTLNTDQNESISELQIGSCSERSPAVSCDQNNDSRMEGTSELDKAKESVEDHGGGGVTDQPVNNIDILTDELNVDAKETDDVIPVTNDSSLHKETSAVVSDDEVVSVTPLQDIDASKGCEVHDDADEAVHAAHSCSTVDEQDASTKLKEDAKSEVDVRNASIVHEQDVNNTSEEGIQDVKQGRDDEPKLEVTTKGTTVDELPDTEAPVDDCVKSNSIVDPTPSAVTCDEGAKGLPAEMSCYEADSGEQSRSNESWQDGCVDMDISDEQTSEEESQGKGVHYEEASLTLEEVDLRTEMGVEPIEDPKPEGGDDASRSDVTTMEQFICQDDDDDDDDDNSNESTMPPLCSVAQQNPEVSRDDAAMVITDVTRETCDRSEGRETLNTNISLERHDSEMHEETYTQDASPLGLHIDTESENSRSCTPTQDELSVNETLYKEHGDESQLQDKYSPEHVYQYKESIDIPFLQEVPMPSAVTTYETTVPEFSDHQLHDLPQDSYWSNCQYDSRLDEQANMSVDVAYKATSRLEDLASTKPQQDQFEDFLPEDYEDSAELPSSWDHGYEAEGLYRRKESYSFDGEEEEDWHYLKKTVYKPKRPSLNESDRLKRMGFSDSTESSERFRSHRQREDLSESDKMDNHGSGSVSHEAERPTTSRSQNEQDEAFDDDDDTLNYSVRRTIFSSTVRTSIVRRQRACPYQHKSGKHPFDWRSYFRRGGIFESNEGNDGVSPDLPSIVTFFNKKGDRVIFEKPATQKRWADVRGMSPGVGDSLLKWEDERTKSDFTQSLMELEYLIFSEKMTHLLKHNKPSSKAKSHKANATPTETPLTIKFSKLDEQDGFVTFDKGWPAISKCKISVDMSERKGLKMASDYGKPFHLRSLYCKKGSEAACSKISEITKDCVKSYHSMMNDICTGKTVPHQRKEVQRKWDGEAATSGKQAAFCGRIKNDMFNNLHDNLNSIVRQACKIKYNFYILVTSRDPFFEETKDLLEAEGHTAVEPYDFELNVSGQTPLLIIMRNQDIAEYICKVPCLLELKKSSRVLFAGIDRPDDVVNLTHQELFARGGFVVFDESAMDALSLENMKNIVGIMEELDKKGKWKWYLHYRNSRTLRENARCSPEAQRRKQFIDCCQEAGIAEVLPYHECDVISRERPDYLRCLVHLQIQNISARFPIFITETPDDSFGMSGIFTMTVHTFSRILSSSTYKVS